MKEYVSGIFYWSTSKEDFLKNFFIDFLKAKLTAQSNEAKMAKLAVLYG